MKQRGIKAGRNAEPSKAPPPTQTSRDPVLVLAEELGKLIGKHVASAEIRRKEGGNSDPTSDRNA